MGDPARHRVFAQYIAERFPDRSLRIADVAGGHGHTRSELYRLGYHNVITIDKRSRRWTTRPHYRYGHFTVDDAKDFDLLLGMHPDDATDVILAGSMKYDVPCIVVPCCTRPTVWPTEARNQDEWIAHLEDRSGAERATLGIAGANRMLVRLSVTHTSNVAP